MWTQVAIYIADPPPWLLISVLPTLLSPALQISVIENDPSLGFINIRAGFHSGRVVASVVGASNPRYCLFGASRRGAAWYLRASILRAFFLPLLGIVAFHPPCSHLSPFYIAVAAPFGVCTFGWLWIGSGAP